MLTWMAYATLAGALLAAAGAVLEQASPWLAGRKRLVWLGVIAGTLILAAAASIPREVVSGAERTNPVAVTAASSLAPKPGSPTGQSSFNSDPRPDAASLASQSGTTSARRTSAAGIDTLLIVLWFLSSVFCVGVLLVSARRVARMRRTWRESVLAGVPVLVSHDVGPAVIGVVHHGIVVPAWAESLSADEQRTVMTHEREHVRAGDPLLLWGATLLVAIMPWNAALWYALRRLRNGIEMDCDTRVLHSRPDTHAYCTLLIDVGERTLAGVAPIAALAEPSTLLERRIEAMTMPLRMGARRIASGAMAALVLVAAACFTPRPEVAPQARVMALVTELGTLLARDSVRQALTPVEKSRIAEALATANDSASLRARIAADSLHVDHAYGERTVQLARDSFPEVFRQSDSAAVVMTVFDANHQLVRSYMKRFPTEDVFDIEPGTNDSVGGFRDSKFLMSRMLPRWRPRLAMSGGQTMSPTSRVVFIFAVMMPGEVPPPAQVRGAGAAHAPAEGRVSGPVIESRVADSVARSLYPATYVPHAGIAVVGLIFSGDGTLLRHASRLASHDEVFVPTRNDSLESGEFSQGGNELLSLVFSGLPEHVGRWSSIAHRSVPGPALAWTILPAGSPLPDARTDAPAVVRETVSRTHRQIRVSLTGNGSDGRMIFIYQGPVNAVEAGAFNSIVRQIQSPGRVEYITPDSIRVALPAELTMNLSPGVLHFVSEDGKDFNLSAQVGSPSQRVSASGKHIVLEGNWPVVKGLP